MATIIAFWWQSFSDYNDFFKIIFIVTKISWRLWPFILCFLSMIFYPSLDVYCPLIFIHPLFFPSLSFCPSLKSCCSCVFAHYLMCIALGFLRILWCFVVNDFLPIILLIAVHELVFANLLLFALIELMSCPSVGVCLHECLSTTWCLQYMSICSSLDVCSRWVFTLLTTLYSTSMYISSLHRLPRYTFELLLGQYWFVWST